MALRPLRGGRVLDQRLGDEPGPGPVGVDPVEADRPVVGEGEPVQRDGLGGHGPPALLVPAGLAVRPLHQVGADLLGPLRLDRRHPPGVDLVGLHELGGHHPVGRPPGQHRTRRDHEPRLAGADELAAVLGRRLPGLPCRRLASG